MIRRQMLMIVTKRLVLLAAISLILTALVFAPAMLMDKRLMLSWLCLECGIIGGFVSIQQRLHLVDDEELAILSSAWPSLLLVPIYGGIFALLLYLLFLSGIVDGHLFPNFYIPPFDAEPTSKNIKDFLSLTYPETGEDLAKLIVWSFIAGFSERFVPQIALQIADKGGQNKE